MFLCVGKPKSTTDVSAEQPEKNKNSKFIKINT
jgi:hypothetical protein